VNRSDLFSIESGARNESLARDQCCTTSRLVIGRHNTRRQVLPPCILWELPTPRTVFLRRRSRIISRLQISFVQKEHQFNFSYYNHFGQLTSWIGRPGFTFRHCQRFLSYSPHQDQLWVPYSLLSTAHWGIFLVDKAAKG
jgi:hypothetical protein